MQALADRIEEQLGGTPLAVVGDCLLQALLPLKRGISREQWETVKQTFQHIIQRVLEAFGP